MFHFLLGGFLWFLQQFLALVPPKRFGRFSVQDLKVANTVKELSRVCRGREVSGGSVWCLFRGLAPPPPKNIITKWLISIETVLFFGCNATFVCFFFVQMVEWRQSLLETGTFLYIYPAELRHFCLLRLVLFLFLHDR